MVRALLTILLAQDFIKALREAKTHQGNLKVKEQLTLERYIDLSGFKHEDRFIVPEHFNYFYLVEWTPDSPVAP
jgi:hypothetical protein